MMRAVILAGLCALALAAKKGATGTIQDMEHIIIFMQENRAFDHYCKCGNQSSGGSCDARCATPHPSRRSHKRSVCSFCFINSVKA
jgi:phospholipase C